MFVLKLSGIQEGIKFFLSITVIKHNNILQYIFPEIASPSRNFNPIMRKSKTIKRKMF